jgi:hypothetical protein
MKQSTSSQLVSVVIPCYNQHAWRKASRVVLGHKPETYDAIGR